MNRYIFVSTLTAALLLGGCQSSKLAVSAPDAIRPRVVSEKTRHDTDDPAIWINPSDPARSLILGTDKDTDGSLYAFDLKGRVVNRIAGLKRPNNVDIVTGLALAGQLIDVAVVTEREEQRLRVFRLPDLTPLDAGDLIVFNGDKERAPMGVALYRRPKDGAVFAVVSGKSGPTEAYLGQYRLEDRGDGKLSMRSVREFGRYSGLNEIEALAVDNELGYLYCADEGFGIRKYHADPDAAEADVELSVFGRDGFAGDHEGISFYKNSDGTGFILVSDQQANRFQVFRREGEVGDPHRHLALTQFPVAAIESDGSETTSVPLPGFPNGLLVAMSNGKVFHYYGWEDLRVPDRIRGEVLSLSQERAGK